MSLGSRFSGNSEARPRRSRRDHVQVVEHSAAGLANAQRINERRRRATREPVSNQCGSLRPLSGRRSETGEQLRVNTGDQRFRQRFAEAARRREESLNATFARAGVDVLVLRTDEDLVRAIVRFAYWRKKRAGRRAAMGASA